MSLPTGNVCGWWTNSLMHVAKMPRIDIPTDFNPQPAK